MENYESLSREEIAKIIKKELVKEKDIDIDALTFFGTVDYLKSVHTSIGTPLFLDLIKKGRIYTNMEGLEYIRQVVKERDEKKGS